MEGENEVLTDAGKREQYDTAGKDGVGGYVGENA